MKHLSFRKLDAFVGPASGGNPAAAIYLDAMDALTECEMQRVAQELKGFVSEVGFVAPLTDDSLRLRYFSAEREVEFCGHATIAILHDLLKREPGKGGIQLHTNRGILSVENRIDLEDAVYIQAPAPVFIPCDLDGSDVCVALNANPETLALDTVPMGIVDAGNRTLCLGFRGLEDVLALEPDLKTLQDFCRRYALDVITVFTHETVDPDCAFRTRVFAAPFGYLEDPATGSGNAALGYHLHRLGAWDGSPICLEQNGERARANRVRLKSIPDAQDVRVWFGGGSACRIEGHYLL